MPCVDERGKTSNDTTSYSVCYVKGNAAAAAAETHWIAHAYSADQSAVNLSGIIKDYKAALVQFFQRFVYEQALMWLKSCVDP